MSDSIRSFGIVGLGKMGAGLAENALAHGFKVAGLDVRPVSDELVKAGVRPAKDSDALAALLPPPRFIMLYVPAGPPVDRLLDQLLEALSPGDIVADGGNSYWGDSIRRHARLKAKGLHFIDAGTSGGPGGARDGACFMIGGEAEPVAKIAPLLRRLAVEGGYVHAGPPGAGHFVKLVHNGIEFGMLQAIGEGMDLLAHYREPLPVDAILQCWNHGSVIRSWLIELMQQMYAAQDGLSATPPYVEDTGEVNWLVDDALHMEVPVPVITQAVVQLIASRDADRDAARAVSLMRHGFGGHPFGADRGIAHERHTGRVGGFVGRERRS
ncbi:MAG: NADP-dependent phosphogluconate dehydrogenase [Xanthobacteraceae bacterium]|uniref:NADP-dependent phosphogluconate dehydrogenase n=1 Tax=Pseudolabrys sp. TaxID=1960880 RepID=UPI003D14D2B6